MMLRSSTIVVLVSAFFLGSMPFVSAITVRDIDCAGPSDLPNHLIPGSRKKYGNGIAPIADTWEDERFRTYRRTLPGFNDFTYNLESLPDGPATLVLQFAEYNKKVCNNGAGGRVFSVAVNGNTVLNNYDVFAAGGHICKEAVTENIPVVVKDGKLDIKFSKIRYVQTPEKLLCGSATTPIK